MADPWPQNGELPPALAWRVGDAAEVLRELPVLDVCFSIYGALWHADPARLLPVIHHRLRSGGILAFSVNGPRDGELPGRRVDNLTLGNGAHLPVVHYSYGADAWWCLLHEHGFTATHALPVEGPVTSLYHSPAGPPQRHRRVRVGRAPPVLLAAGTGTGTGTGAGRGGSGQWVVVAGVPGG
ncbi:hypothetical protein C9F11_42515 [Streptomyces sp. YIM 121038]|uniref:hypothetical protein n=1 Tax=Streptomyces sp. YIM 121038 TaxID=2136401 RepID=UPI001110EA50|nr:hypothetical protein [Streptomyces sp. YIM 121038]QCX73736.1 hypothetical protein C9F11_00165 [Streptomyces sp. YIM 121038]QCX82083.1 hypothetical protein C9F11_42515 [Streptomyces sp. YIM 121038]